MSKSIEWERRAFAKSKGIEVANKLKHYAPHHLEVERLMRQGISRAVAEGYFRHQQKKSTQRGGNRDWRSAYGKEKMTWIKIYKSASTS